MVDFEYDKEVYTIRFDDEKTSPESIVAALGKGGFKIKGKPTLK